MFIFSSSKLHILQFVAWHKNKYRFEEQNRRDLILITATEHLQQNTQVCSSKKNYLSKKKRRKEN